MNADERLESFFTKGGVTFSIEQLNKELFYVTITKVRGSSEDTVGGSFESVDEGINYCIDYLENVARKRSIKLIDKKEASHE